MVILRYPGMLSEKAKQKIKDDIDEQLKNHSGILITDGCPEIIKIGPEEDASRLFGGNPVPPPAIATLSKEDNIND
jgi:hypothetical protein